jgi:hypothetical protein
LRERVAEATEDNAVPCSSIVILVADGPIPHLSSEPIREGFDVLARDVLLAIHRLVYIRLMSFCARIEKARVVVPSDSYVNPRIPCLFGKRVR